MPDAYARVVERGVDYPQDILQNERELCGIDHCHAGRSLVTAWNLPEAFLATACHHDDEALATGAASLIPPSCELADSLGFAVIRCRSARSYAEVLTAFPEPTRNRFPAEAEELGCEIANGIAAIESA